MTLIRAVCHTQLVRVIVLKLYSEAFTCYDRPHPMCGVLCYRSSSKTKEPTKLKLMCT
jgi:hypothetical protein